MNKLKDFTDFILAVSTFETKSHLLKDESKRIK